MLRRVITSHLRSSVLICGFLALVFVPESHAQQLYKCTLANGRVQYQQEPCADAAKQSTVRAPDPVAAKSDAELKSANEKSAAAAELQMSQVIVTIANASVCASDAPGWDAKYSAALAAWKGRNGAQVAKFDSDAEARAKAIAFIESERARYATNKPGLAATCEAFGARLAPPAAPAAPAK